MMDSAMLIIQFTMLFALFVILIMSRRMSRDGTKVLKNKIDQVEADLKAEVHNRFETFSKRFEELEKNLSQLEEKGKRNSELFGTVLHGFDYIVQGCKKALQEGDSEKSSLDASLKSLLESKVDEKKNEEPLYKSIPIEEPQDS